MKETFYLTTTLPYVNADPHIGFALELVQADTIARFQRLLGKKVFFNTGTDEHGLKIFRKAAEANLSPQKYVDGYATRFQRLKDALGLTYNSFLRTTDPAHLAAAQEFWQRCTQAGDIYKATQEIKYCVGCEMEKTDSELVDNRCPLHPNREIEILAEENYFFRFSKYQKPLLDWYEKNPDFVLPASRYVEIKKFVRRGLKDFSISRLKEKMPWGVPVPDDEAHVMYVWFDALVNYVTAVGWPENLTEFSTWWPVIQLAGKDNLRQQAAMWQAMLMSARLPCSARILIHGFVTANGQKMSKSLGNVVNPLELVEHYGTDAVRYYLLREIPPFKDGDYSETRFRQLYNADLANGLGNLVQRVAVLAGRAHLDNQPNTAGIDPEFKRKLAHYHFNTALGEIWSWASALDLQINRAKPWEKEGPELSKILRPLIHAPHHQPSLLKIGYHLQPFLPTTAEKIISLFTAPLIVPPKKPLFPRLP